MSWKLDNIDFEDYGVYVSKSSGVFDLPRMVDRSNNWLDENGKDVWQPIEQVKYEDREIVLSCWVKAAGYAQLKTKVAAFFAALLAEGVRSLSTPYGFNVDVSLQDSVQVARKTSYVASLQLGIFNLKLTVSGSDKRKYINVFNGQWLSVPYVDAKLTKQIQGIPEITFTTEVNTPVAHGTGNYLFFDNEKYVAFDYPELQKLASNKFIYKLSFKHQFLFLNDVQFRVLDRSDTPWESTVEQIIDMIIVNAERAHPGLFVKGEIFESESRVNTFSNETCFEVLVRIAKEYELEWEYLTLEDATIQISVKKTIDSETGLTFEYGKENELYKVTRVKSSRENLCTKLYAYGSDKNIPASYGYPRLKLAVEPIVFPFFGMEIERTKIFEDIYPTRTGTVSSYVTKVKESTWVYAPGTENSASPVKIYTNYPNDNTYELTDSSMDFDLKEKYDSGNPKYEIPGTSAKIHMNTGDLAGFEFEVLDYDHLTKTFKLIPYSDEQGTKYPNATLYLKPGDQYKIIDINLPESYTADAEQRLSVAANDWLNNLMAQENTFEIESKPMAEYQALIPGNKVTLVDTNLGLEKILRVAQVTTNLMNFVNNITLADWLNKPKLNDLTLKVAKLEANADKAKLNEPNQVMASAETTAEVKNKMIDQLDGLLKADDIVRSKSLDPRMFSVDASTIQFSIKGAAVQAGLDGDPNKIRIEAGSFLSHNFYAVDRRNIIKIKEKL